MENWSWSLHPHPQLSTLWREVSFLIPILPTSGATASACASFCSCGKVRCFQGEEKSDKKKYTPKEVCSNWAHIKGISIYTFHLFNSSRYLIFEANQIPTIWITFACRNCCAILDPLPGRFCRIAPQRVSRIRVLSGWFAEWLWSILFINKTAKIWNLRVALAWLILHESEIESTCLCSVYFLSFCWPPVGGEKRGQM